jgi:tRNA (cytidine32/uridine32-2'-O)-methyltransferase
VQVLAYEVRCALLEPVDGAVPITVSAGSAPPGDGAASHAELEGLFGQLAETLEQIDFHKGRAPESAMRKLRRLYLRANLDSADIRLLRGVLADAQRMARLASGHGS